MNNLLGWMAKYREILSYLFWGVMTTIVSWGSYSIFALLLKNQNTMMTVFGISMPIVVFTANIFSWVCAIIFAFVTNKLWVFQSKSWKTGVFLPELGKFISARLITGLLEIVAVPLLVGIGLDQTILGVEGMIAKIVVSILIVLLNYVFSKIFIFKG